MHAIMGITGQIGGGVARSLLASEQPVRAVARDAAKGQAWSARGCEVALATIDDANSLAAAFRGAESVFVLVPPNFVTHGWSNPGWPYEWTIYNFFTVS
jgi:uncharacterized protein YbjT (DUF2867 family)